jgi:POTRA domain, FtsQ-type
MIWFKRKPRNRRLGHDHVLDVKLRSDQVRASRMRLAAIALSMVFATVLGFYMVWRAGEWALNQLVYENKAFAVQEIQVQTDGIIAVDQLRRWAGVKPGENLLALDLARVKRNVEMMSMVQSVAVERILPHTLRLRVTERDPLAQVYVPQFRTNGGVEMNILHLDDAGYVMALLDPRQRATPPAPGEDTLPVICGCNQNEFIPGRRVESQQTRAALQLVSAFNHSSMAGLVDLRKIDVSSPEILRVTTGQGSEITFSTHDLDRQLRLWRGIYDWGQRMNKGFATLDLSVSNNVPARLTMAGAPPPTGTKIKNPQRTRRKNV